MITRESLIMETSVLRLAVQLLTVLVLLGGPIVQSLEVDIAVGDGSPSHHYVVASDEHDGKHGRSFRVVSCNGVAAPIPEWCDTVLMAPREKAEIAFIADNPGD